MKLGFKLIGGAILALASSWALATPTYTGDTFGTFNTPCTGDAAADCPTGGDTHLQPAPYNTGGYWIWSTDSNKGHDWSIRWTGGVKGPFDDTSNFAPTFQGTVFADAGNGLSYELVSFDTSATQPYLSDIDNGPSPMPGFDNFSWSAVAGQGWDGIDFSFSSNSGFNLEFLLTSSLFTDQGGLIYIGDSLGTPSTQIGGPFDGLFEKEYSQSFGIKIPEPGTLALLGLGLAGLGFSRRKVVK